MLLCRLNRGFIGTYGGVMENSCDSMNLLLFAMSMSTVCENVRFLITIIHCVTVRRNL
jgi:hypothetical protein